MHAERPALLRAQAALALLARRQESLRTHFVERDGQLLQAVVPADDSRGARVVGRAKSSCLDGQLRRGAPQLQRRSLPGSADDDAELATIVDELSDQPFQVVGAGVPLRAVLIAAGADDHVLFIGNHHILRREGSLSAAAPATHNGSLACCAYPSSLALVAGHLAMSLCPGQQERARLPAFLRSAWRLVQRRHQRRDPDV